MKRAFTLQVDDGFPDGTAWGIWCPGCREWLELYGRARQGEPAGRRALLPQHRGEDAADVPVWPRRHPGHTLPLRRRHPRGRGTVYPQLLLRL